MIDLIVFVRARTSVKSNAGEKGRRPFMNNIVEADVHDSKGLKR